MVDNLFENSERNNSSCIKNAENTFTKCRLLTDENNLFPPSLPKSCSALLLGEEFFFKIISS